MFINKKNFLQEEEWKDYREEIKDYTTLKIQNLTADSNTNYSDSDKDNEIEFEENEAGEMIPKRKNTGPWKVSDIEPIPLPKGICNQFLTTFISQYFQCRWQILPTF